MGYENMVVVEGAGVEGGESEREGGEDGRYRG